MLVLKGDGKEIEIGDELEIETDGRMLTIRGGKYSFRKEYDSVLEILCIMMWLMKNVRKTTVHFMEGTHDFVRKREYQGYKDTLRL